MANIDKKIKQLEKLKAKLVDLENEIERAREGKIEKLAKYKLFQIVKFEDRLGEWEMFITGRELTKNNKVVYTGYDVTKQRIKESNIISVVDRDVDPFRSI